MLSFSQFIESMASETGLPVGIKSAIGKLEQWEELAAYMVKTNSGPDFITIDGGEGGTGAAAARGHWAPAGGAGGGRPGGCSSRRIRLRAACAPPGHQGASPQADPGRQWRRVCPGGARAAARLEGAAAA